MITQPEFIWTREDLIKTGFIRSSFELLIDDSQGFIRLVSTSRKMYLRKPWGKSQGMSLRRPGRSLIANAKSDDMLKAIILAKDEMKMEIEKYKFKKIDQQRREQRKMKGRIE